MKLTLPWPPSINHYYGNFRGRVYISAKGKAFRKRVGAELDWTKGTFSPNDRLRVRLELFPPDNRRRDVDNIQKPVLDSLEHAGLFANDSQIDDLHTIRREKRDGGQVLITVEIINVD